MACSPRPIALALLALGLAVLLAGAGPAAAQNCGCQQGFCCSKFGFCGTTEPYCGDGCQAGPCWGKGNTPPTGGGSSSVEGIVTDAFFNGIKSRAGSQCAGKSFYTRGAFLEAARKYSGFGGGSSTDAKREIAAYFAHVTHETGSMCYIEEINQSDPYCDATKTQWPCQSGKKYFGRGPLQISWNYNYGPAGRDIGFDGLGNPEKVAQDATVAFKTSLWYWMNNVHGVMGQGFGATTRAINGNLECDGKNPTTVNARAGYYRDYCSQLGVDPGSNLTC